MIFFVVPAYNERENIPGLLDGMRRKLDATGLAAHTIIVDDASTDGTGDLARAHAALLSLEVVRNPVNLGVAQAFRAGFRRALELAGPGDVIVTKEADNTSDLTILEPMLERIRQGCDVALASCFAPEGKVINSTLNRHVLSFGANLLLRTFFPIPGVHTYSSFYRAYRADVLQRAFQAYDGRMIECRGFACMVEMLVKLRRLSVRMTEVPMVLQCDLRRGPSKMVRRQTILEYVRLIRREAFRSPEECRRIRAAFDAAPAAGWIEAELQRAS